LSIFPISLLLLGRLLTCGQQQLHLEVCYALVCKRHRHLVIDLGGHGDGGGGCLGVQLGARGIET